MNPETLTATTADADAPNVQKETVRQKGGDNRGGYAVTRPNGRKELTPAEVEAIIKQAKKNRHGSRDAAMIDFAYHHALRSVELCNLLWSDINFSAGQVYIRRSKQRRIDRATAKNASGWHDMTGNQLRALRRLQRASNGPCVFTSERGAPFTTAGFRILMKRAGTAAGIPWAAPHALRHGCITELVSRGVNLRSVMVWAGHSDIRTTEAYAAASATTTRGIWD